VIVPTQTVTAIQIPTLTPSLTRRPPTTTPTITPTFTIMPPPTLTWTPRPTLPPYQAQAMALNLLKNNGGCLLPCWIGISPGKTTWDEAYAFLSIFADQIPGGKDDLSNVHTVRFKLSDASYNGGLETGATIYTDKGVVDRITVFPEDISLSDLLATYGLPSEIRIHAIGIYTMSPKGRFTLILFYKDKGILAVYDGINEKSNIIHICPDNIQGPQQIWLLWSPAKEFTFSEAGKQILLFSNPPPPAEKDYNSLGDVSNLTINDFYQRYKDPKNGKICIEMKAPDWDPADWTVTK